jgi:hypothetical protein
MNHVIATAGLDIPEDAQVIELPAGLQLPDRMVLDVDRDGFDIQAVVVFDAERQQYVCDQIRVSRQQGGAPVTGEALRTMRVKQLVDDALTLAQIEVTDSDAKGVSQLGYVPGALPPVEQSKQGPTEQTLRWVAQAYLLATVVGAPPTKRVQDQLGVSRATAARWVAEARTLGLLPPVEGGDDGRH